VQEQLAQIFVAGNQARVIVPPLGAAMAAKRTRGLSGARASQRKARRPVMVLTRDESFTGRRYGAVVKIKTGFKKDGRIVARHGDVL
jgi:CO/xanthine dehydrogenase Mo-binding subunit